MTLHEIIEENEREFEEKYLPTINSDGETYSCHEYMFPSGGFADDVKSFLRQAQLRLLERVVEKVSHITLSPQIGDYLKIVKEGNFDTMFDYAVNLAGKEIKSLLQAEIDKIGRIINHHPTGE